MIPTLAVLVRVLANPVSNVLQKQLAQRSASPLCIIAATHVLLSLVCLPALALWTPIPTARGFWSNIAICAILAVSSNVVLVYALREGDLSVLGPVNAYKPVIALATGVFLIGELPSAMGLTGVALTLAGSYFIADPTPGASQRSALVALYTDRGVQMRIAALILSAVEAVFLKRALLESAPLVTFLVWAILGVPVAAAFLVLAGRTRLAHEWQTLRANGGRYLALALATGAMQCATLFTFSHLQVGYSLALFQLSAAVSVLLGYRYFGEPSFRKRLTGSVVMAAGATLIVLQ